MPDRLWQESGTRYDPVKGLSQIWIYLEFHGLVLLVAQTPEEKNITRYKSIIRKSRYTGVALAVALAVLSISNPATAQETYRPGEQVISVGAGFFGGGRALLTMPRGKPVAVVILMPGGGGDIGLSDAKLLTAPAPKPA